MRILSEKNENLRITGYEAETGYPFDTCEIRQVGKGEEYEIILRLKGSPEPGKIEDTLCIHTNNTLQPRVEIPVFGLVTRASAGASGLAEE